jgi:hypothetical protein
MQCWISVKIYSVKPLSYGRGNWIYSTKSMKKSKKKACLPHACNIHDFVILVIKVPDQQP